MVSLSPADKLDQAITRLLADMDGEIICGDSAAADIEFNELLEIAGLMRLIPDPEFRADLKDDLLVQAVAVQGVQNNGHAVAARPAPKPAPRQTVPTEVLPSFLSMGPKTYPVHRSNF